MPLWLADLIHRVCKQICAIILTLPDHHLPDQFATQTGHERKNDVSNHVVFCCLMKPQKMIRGFLIAH